MIIADLNHIETVSAQTEIKGAIAFASASSTAQAAGKYFSVAVTSTGTLASGFPGLYISLSGSSSKSVAG